MLRWWQRKSASVHATCDLSTNGCSVTSTGNVGRRHSRNLSRTDPSGEDLGLQYCWRSGLRHSAVPERARLTHSDEEERMSRKLKKYMNECKHLIEGYTDSEYYACQHVTHV